MVHTKLAARVGKVVKPPKSVRAVEVVVLLHPDLSCLHTGARYQDANGLGAMNVVISAKILAITSVRFMFVSKSRCALQCRMWPESSRCLWYRSRRSH